RIAGRSLQSDQSSAPRQPEHHVRQRRLRSHYFDSRRCACDAICGEVQLLMKPRSLSLVAGAVCLSAAISAQNDWRTYGNDPGHQRFSTLTQIAPGNVSQLTKAWDFDSKSPGRKWQNTPVVIDGVMYI